ncbi:hypothetical protein SAMN05421876_1075 [Kaistella jeonii]|uniref:Uncharacterized protein n=1 Tax=Kaistella jeonii TaxID=266749 RepID=A0A0C1F6S8_9FLAO|nr:hypothetical protein OA86_09615 [Kaistella jeonii]SFC12235.1 hypothetical protein SAMN05421876_1075 [Kaistella jeonii]VEI94512.1 Uncharacterised protein [Kaistella jeonii]
MTLKQATLLAIFAIVIQVLISICYILQLPYYMVLSALGILSNLGLLPFFVLIYQKQKDGN